MSQVKNLWTKSSAALALLFILLNPYELVAQFDQLYPNASPLDQLVKDVEVLNDGSRYILAGRDFGGSSPGVFRVSLFDAEQNAFTDLDLNMLNLSETERRSLVSDMIKVPSGDILILLNPYFALREINRDAPGQFSILRIASDLSNYSIKTYQRPMYRGLFAQDLLRLNDSTDNVLVSGSQRYASYDFGELWYFAELNDDSLVYEGFSTGDFSNFYFNNDVVTIDSAFYIYRFTGTSWRSTQVFVSNRDSAGNFSFQQHEPFSLPFENEPSADIEGNQKNAYANACNSVIQISDSVCISDSFYVVSWPEIKGSSILRFDTTSIGLYYFTPSLDSIKFVDLSYQFLPEGTDEELVSHITHSSVSDNKKRICFTGTMNQDIYNNPPPTGNTSGIVAMLDDTGKVFWNYQLKEEGNNIRLTTSVPTQDGGCLFAGDWFKEGVTNGRDMIVVKLDSTGTLTSISDESLAHLFDRQKIAVYPNPAKSQGKVNLSWSGIGSQNWVLQLFNNQGQVVYNTNITQAQKEVQIPLPQLPKGNYILRATGNNKQVHTGTLVLE